MKDFLNKCKSRKFILAVVGIAAGIAMAFGVDGNDIIAVIGKVSGIISATSIALGYISGESKIDAARESRGKEE